MTAEALEHLIAERFGVRPVQVSVRGNAPDWTATLIARWQGNVTRQVAFLSLVDELRADYDLKRDDYDHASKRAGSRLLSVHARSRRRCFPSSHALRGDCEADTV